MSLLLAALPSLLAVAIFWATFSSRRRPVASEQELSVPSRQRTRVASTPDEADADRRAA